MGMKQAVCFVLSVSLIIAACNTQPGENSEARSKPAQEKEKIPDLYSLTADLEVPPVWTGKPEPGKRVRQTLSSYASTEVYHLTYLPENWEPGKLYPVIIEYPGNGPWSNDIGDVSTGKVEGCNLGYGISGGRDFIWISMPFVSEDGQHNQDWWWGDIAATKAYYMQTIASVCRDLGGNENEVILSGFSRGAIGVNYIGLHDEEISKIWIASIANSHYDGLKQWNYPDDDEAAARERLTRMNGRPQFICQEVPGISRTRQYLEQSGIEGDFTFMDIPYRNHTNTWVLYDIPERKIIRDWLMRVMDNRKDSLTE